MTRAVRLGTTDAANEKEPECDFGKQLLGSGLDTEDRNVRMPDLAEPSDFLVAESSDNVRDTVNWLRKRIDRVRVLSICNGREVTASCLQT